MGLNINGNTVEVDPSHNRLLNTSLVGNPYVQIIGVEPNELYVHSTFQRHLTPNSMSHDPAIRAGDNCHLIYALKRKDGWTTTFGSVRYLRRNFTTIAKAMKLAAADHPYDLIIPMPSGHAISNQYADRLSDILNCPVQKGVFAKITLEDARQQLARTNLKSSEKKKLANRLQGTGAFPIKAIPTKYRHLFSAVVLQAQQVSAEAKHILLVDDLLATGSTLLTARDLLQRLAPEAIIEAACLFSAV